jgi:hypothetical protein
VVDNNREVALPFANRDLIHPDPLQPGEQVALGGLLGHHSLADPADRPPRDPHQLRDRGLGRLHRQPRDLILEAAGEVRVVPRPRDRSDEYTVALAADPGRLGLQVGERRAQIERPPPPATLTPVIARATPPTMRAAIALAGSRADRQHQRPVLLELDVLDDRPTQPEQLLPYASSAHAAIALSSGS